MLDGHDDPIAVGDGGDAEDLLDLCAAAHYGLDVGSLMVFGFEGLEFAVFLGEDLRDVGAAEDGEVDDVKEEQFRAVGVS